MPFKDPERRKAYNTAYQRQRRRRAGLHVDGFRCYVCPRFPHLRLDLDISFDQALLVTDDPEVQDLIESSPDFWREIFPLALDYGCLPILEKEENEYK
jgi:hypothetical protein